jgi:hypothetical protein
MGVSFPGEYYAITSGGFLEVLRAERITAAGRRGSSRPVIVETPAGIRLVKLRGAAQGTGPLVAEIIVGELAESIGLHVPARSLVTLPAEIETADWDDELADVLAASVGVNLGFDYLDGAHEVSLAEIHDIPVATQARILWLDRLVLNPDRTARNPHLLQWGGPLWLVDHGAALGFQYDWERLTEELPRQRGWMPDPHLFESTVSESALRHADEEVGRLLTRSVIERAVAQVPDDFLTLHDAEQRRRRRAVYAAYIWKRLQPPRPFLEVRELPERRVGGAPAWLTGKPSSP